MGNGSGTGTYFQFPISHLRHCLDPDFEKLGGPTRLVSSLMRWALFYNGKKAIETAEDWWFEYGRATEDDFIEEIRLEFEGHTDFEPRLSKHIEIAAYAKMIGIVPGSFCETIRDAENLGHGGKIFTRIRKDIMFDARDGAFSFELFRCFVAIQSIVQGGIKLVRREVIARRMDGFESREQIGDRKPSTDVRKVSRLVRGLEERSLVSTCRASRRDTYYSIATTQKEIQDFVLKRIKEKEDRKIRRKSRDLEFQARIAQLRIEQRATLDAKEQVISNLRRPL